VEEQEGETGSETLEEWEQRLELTPPRVEMELAVVFGWILLPQWWPRWELNMYHP
jgi:hypothetical protein